MTRPWNLSSSRFGCGGCGEGAVLIGEQSTAEMSSPLADGVFRARRRRLTRAVLGPVRGAPFTKAQEKLPFASHGSEWRTSRAAPGAPRQCRRRHPDGLQPPVGGESGRAHLGGERPLLRGGRVQGKAVCLMDDHRRPSCPPTGSHSAGPGRTPRSGSPSTFLRSGRAIAASEGWDGSGRSHQGR